MTRKHAKVARLSPRLALETADSLHGALNRAVDAAIASSDALREGDAAELVKALDALGANADRARFLAGAFWRSA